MIGVLPVADQLTPFAEGIRSVAIRLFSTLREARPNRFGRRFRILLIAIVPCLSLAIRVIGVVTIVGWIWGPGSRGDPSS